MCNKLLTKPLEAVPQFSLDQIRKQIEAETETKHHNDDRLPEPAVEQDILAISTVCTKRLFNSVQTVCDNLRSSTAYSIVTRTTQPAHVAVMVATLLVAASLQPTHRKHSDDAFYKFIYIATSAAHFGSQIWMTFASGLSLYFSLPRHHFGEVQKVLFPLYFTLTSILSLATLLARVRLTSSDETTVILTLCFFTELFVRLYLCDPLVTLICTKNKLEAGHGVGMEIGKLSHNSELFSSQEYVKVHKRFRRLHMCIAISNVVCIALSTVHLYLAVSHISFNC